MTATESLTEWEQQALEHMRKAQELGTTLKAYASQAGLDLKQLYYVRGRLVRKGALGPVRREAKGPHTADKASAFLPVRVVSAASALGSPAVACRLVHPSGWVLECNGLPPASWVTAVLAGGAHATA
jgi:hypothetical protein